MSRTRGSDPAGNPTPLSCDELQEVAPDLALDLLDGTTRAAALAHLEGCAACRTEVARLTETAGQALLASPEVPPPAGFEQRVLARLGLPATEPPPRPEPAALRSGRARGRSHRRRALAAVAAVAVAVAGLVGVLVGDAADRETTVALMRTAQGTVVGEVALQQADPPVLGVDLAAWTDTWERYDQEIDGRLWLKVEAGDRSDAYLLAPGTASVTDLTGELTLRGTDADDVTSVSVVDDAGRVWCTADLDQA